MGDSQSPILTVSHSQLSSWDRCNFKWHLAYEEGWTLAKPTRSLEIGSVVHDFLRVYYQTGSLEKALELAHEYYTDDMDAQTLEAMSIAVWIVSRYVQDVIPGDIEWEVVEVEYHFVLPLLTPKGREYNLQGYVDLIMKHLPTGKLWVWDHKTSQSSKGYTPIEVMMDPQLPTYAAALKLTQGWEIFGLCHNLIKAYNYKDKDAVPAEKLFRREKHFRSDTELNNLLVQLGLSVDEIYEYLEKGETPRRSLRTDCSSCWFQEPCLYGLKGLPMEELLQIDFKRKDG